jgi:hypothetical protein
MMNISTPPASTTLGPITHSDDDISYMKSILQGDPYDLGILTKPQTPTTTTITSTTITAKEEASTRREVREYKDYREFREYKDYREYREKREIDKVDGGEKEKGGGREKKELDRRREKERDRERENRERDRERDREREQREREIIRDREREREQIIREREQRDREQIIREREQIIRDREIREREREKEREREREIREKEWERERERDRDERDRERQDQRQLQDLQDTPKPKRRILDNHRREPQAADPYHEAPDLHETSRVNSITELMNRQLPVRYFIMKCVSHNNLQIALQNHIWATQAHNEHKLNDAYQNAEVVLIFSVNNSRHFQAYGRMASRIGSKSSIWHHNQRILGGVFRIEWICVQDLPFHESEHLCNPLNENKPVKISRDGQEIPENIGYQLCRLIDKGVKLNSKYLI